MHLRDLELAEFRSFRGLALAIDPAGFRAVGPNASGKSTLLEAIAMLATTRSPRTSAEREIANWQSGHDLAVPPYARVRGLFERSDRAHSIEIGMSIDEGGQKPLRKQIRFDDRAVRAIDAVGQFKTVLFSPDDVDLISGAPAARRRYLDMAISQASRTYLRGLSRYSRVLEQRNSLLRTFSRERPSPGAARPTEELMFWDSELIVSAVDVIAERSGAIGALASGAKLHYSRLTGDDSLELTYVPNRFQLPAIDESPSDWQRPTQPLRQAISASLAAALATWRAEELRRGVTAVGPHRDDFKVVVGGVDIGRYGSRGQQRLAIIAIKLGELELLQDAAGEPPVLLLDDVLSELDSTHRSSVVAMIATRHAQICVTATDESDIGSSELGHLPILRTNHGTVRSFDQI